MSEVDLTSLLIFMGTFVHSNSKKIKTDTSVCCISPDLGSLFSSLWTKCVHLV